jgi:hypothetical protein
VKGFLVQILRIKLSSTDLLHVYKLIHVDNIVTYASLTKVFRYKCVLESVKTEGAPAILPDSVTQRLSLLLKGSFPKQLSCDCRYSLPTPPEGKHRDSVLSSLRPYNSRRSQKDIVVVIDS